MEAPSDFWILKDGSIVRTDLLNGRMTEGQTSVNAPEIRTLREELIVLAGRRGVEKLEAGKPGQSFESLRLCRISLTRGGVGASDGIQIEEGPRQCPRK
jgi:hypothetical protein